MAYLGSKKLAGILAAVVFSASPLANAVTTDQIVAKEEQRIKDGQKSQKRIDNIADKSEQLAAEYRTENKIVDGLKVYNQQLQSQLNNQLGAIKSLEASIKEAAIVERQILPLMVKMIDALDIFVSEDMPFSLQERRERVENLRAYLSDSNISAAERFRKVLEAYEIENAYGRSIETYSDKLSLGQQTLAVDMLRVGRVGLYYQTKDGKASGAWDNKAKNWVALDSQNNRAIRQAIRIGAKQLAPDLLDLPVVSPEAK